MPQPSAAPADNQPNSFVKSTGAERDRRPGIVREANRFWQRVTDGIAIDQLMSQFKRDARTSFEFYRRDFDLGAPPNQRGWKNWLQILNEMVWAILGKLTPARRVLLLLAVIFLVLPSGNFRFAGPNGHDIQISTPGFQFWSAVLLFVLLMLEVADRVVMKRDLEIARDIQSWLLPAAPPVVPGLTIAFATRPANTVAGDFYDVFSRPEANSDQSHFLIAVADVAGKSIPAALLMATFQASLKTLSTTSYSLLELAAAMNRYACCNSQGGLRFTTAFLAEYNLTARTLAYVNAGHNNPILRRVSGATERLDAGGLPLGILPDATYASAEVVLSAGDWLAIFTDGLVEAENNFAAAYGEDRLLGAINAGIAASPEVLLQQIISSVNNFVGTTPQHDDITCMLIKAV
ncbi:MAG TPA: PP2C family protein-serine/threonine phosphatase [Terriglobales bacterium]|nr:PP2C family protein-serine/threonine phosphatase [Terriglobales bacterium]